MGYSRLGRFYHWLPAALAVAVIAIESTAAMSAANTSRWLLPIWVHFFGPITPEHWQTVHNYIRKTGHFTGYGMVSLCFFHGWRKTLQPVYRTVHAVWVRSAIFAVGCTILIASADEFHQLFVPGRTGRAFDVGIDTCGAIIVQLLLLGLMRLFTRKLTLQAFSA